MNNYRFNSIVSNSEQEALKEMIFKRARERALALTNEVDNTYTNSVQNEIMDLARDSFVSSKNPFSQRNEEEAKENKINETKSQEIGFAKRHVDEIKAQIRSRNNENNSEVACKEVLLTMSEASASLRNKQTFMGALDFLNSQASIALVKGKGKAFEALA